MAFWNIGRFHIIAIASLTSVCFGWLFSSRLLWMAAALCAIDWFVVNLVNRVVDLAEDRANGIAGTDFVSRHGRLFERISWALLLSSLALGHRIWPEATPFRVAFHAIGLAYNYKLIPSPKGRTRFKEMYFLKNFSSAALFVLSTTAYPAAISGAHPEPEYVAVLIGFFMPLEITYEIAYDLRDVKGDRELNVPTFPVVHGIEASLGIVWTLLAMSAASLVAGAAFGVIGLKEFVLVAGVVQQALYFKLRLAREATAERCIFVTWLGAAQVASYILWVAIGLPTELPW